MRRAAVALVVIGLAGCGDGDEKKRAAPVEKSKERSATERDLERVRESDLPEDAKRELEEAAELLERSR